MLSFPALLPVLRLTSLGSPELYDRARLSLVFLEDPADRTDELRTVQQ